MNLAGVLALKEWDGKMSRILIKSYDDNSLSRKMIIEMDYVILKHEDDTYSFYKNRYDGTNHKGLTFDEVVQKLKGYGVI